MNSTTTTWGNAKILLTFFGQIATVEKEKILRLCFKNQKSTSKINLKLNIWIFNEKRIKFVYEIKMKHKISKLDAAK